MAMAQRRFSRNPFGLFFFGLVVAAIILGSWSFIQGGWGSSIRPVQAVSRWFAHLRPSPSTEQLLAERTRLRQQVDVLNHQLALAQDQLRTSHNLDQLQAYTQSSRHRIVSAKVVTLNPDPGVYTIVIGRGSVDGLRIGMVVTTPDGTVIGKLQQVHARLSTVLILTDSQSAVASRVDNAPHSPGVAVGERGLSVRMEYIPKSDPVEAGQVVVTSGTEPLIPAGLVIGSVSSISSRSGDVFQTAAITSSIDVASLNVVGVITS